MHRLLVTAIAIAAVFTAAEPAFARSTTCASAIRQLEASRLRSRAAIEQVGRAKSALAEGRQRDCLTHVQQARQDERQLARNGRAYSGSSMPPSSYRRSAPDDHSADALNRRELERTGRY
jgi:hypothetical protein